MAFTGFVGETQAFGAEVTAYVYSHLRFEILYNEDRVIHVSVAGEQPKSIASFFSYCQADLFPLVSLGLHGDDMTIEFSFSVKWRYTDVTFEHRLDYLKNEKLFPHELEIHWLSILNSVVLVVLLTGFVFVIILRILKADYARYSRATDLGDDTEDYGTIAA